MNHVVIRVPASTSNLGSGFDTLGLAVKLYTRVDARLSNTPGIRSASRTEERPHPAAIKLLNESANLFFKSAGVETFGVEVSLSGNVPMARGLGYSATLRVGVLAALNEFSGKPLDRSALLNLATQLESHPDNASPSIFGGFTVSGMVQTQVRCLNFPVPEATRLVTLVPDFPVSTEEARKLMPASFSKPDATHALNRAALITAAFASGDLQSLRGLFDDRIHQPYREALIPKLSEVISAGENVGALGGFLSGSGSAIICLAREQPEVIGEAMRRMMPQSQVLILEPDNSGFAVE
jgi:homoserine kinase